MLASLRIHPILKLCINKHSHTAVRARYLAKQPVIWCINYKIRLLTSWTSPARNYSTTTTTSYYKLLLLPREPKHTMKRCLTSACSAAVIALLTLAGSPIVNGQDECFPSDSMFSDIRCECMASTLDAERFQIDCSTNQRLFEFPVLNTTYPLVIEM